MEFLIRQIDKKIGIRENNRKDRKALLKS